MRTKAYTVKSTLTGVTRTRRLPVDSEALTPEDRKWLMDGITQDDLIELMDAYEVEEPVT